MSCVEVYGFGSFFKGEFDYSDIDLLLVHENRSLESCAFAIECKRNLQLILQDLHVTMLSKEAEHSFSFKLAAQAIHLGCIDTLNEGRDLEEIAASIRAYSVVHKNVKS